MDGKDDYVFSNTAGGGWTVRTIMFSGWTVRTLTTDGGGWTVRTIMFSHGGGWTLMAVDGR